MIPEEFYHRSPSVVLSVAHNQLIRYLRQGALEEAALWLTRYTTVANALIERRSQVRRDRLDPSRLP